MAVLLSQFFSVFPNALQRARKNLQNKGTNSNSNFHNAVRDHATPLVLKRLGDGAMIVWEFPQEAGEPKVETGLALFILDFVGYVQEGFYQALDKLKQAHAARSHLDILNLGVGLSCGAALNMSYGKDDPLDYAGSHVNIAARLQDKARPFGIVANLELDANCFMERSCAGEGHICRVDLGGISDKVSVWHAVDLPKMRTRRVRRLATVDQVGEWIKQPFDDPNRRPPGVIPLNEVDTISVFDARESWEGDFAADLAGRCKQSHLGVCNEIQDTIDRMGQSLSGANFGHGRPPAGFQTQGRLFHSLIAEHSNSKEGTKRRKFADSIYEFTKDAYSSEPNDLDEIVKEHIRILKAIRDGDRNGAKLEMASHLGEHYKRVRKMLLTNAPDCP